MKLPSFLLILTSFVLVATFLFVPHCQAQTAATCPVTLVARGVQGTQGTVGFVVYATKEGWPAKFDLAFRSAAKPAKEGNISVTIDLPEGRYAVAVLHDENGNKKLDRTPSGRPREGFGISNNPKAVLKTPSFSSAIVDLTCNSRLLIQMRYPRNYDSDTGETTKQ